MSSLVSCNIVVVVVVVIRAGPAAAERQRRPKSEPTRTSERASARAHDTKRLLLRRPGSTNPGRARSAVLGETNGRRGAALVAVHARISPASSLTSAAAARAAMRTHAVHARRAYTQVKYSVPPPPSVAV